MAHYDPTKRYFMVWVNAVNGHTVGEIQKTYTLETINGELSNSDLESGDAILVEITEAQKDPNVNLQAVETSPSVWEIQTIV